MITLFYLCIIIRASVSELPLVDSTDALLASFPGSPSFRAIISRMTFDPSGWSKVIRGRSFAFGRVKGHTWNYYCAEAGNEASYALSQESA